MAVYVVTYDLNKETKRPPIVKEIKAYDEWVRLSESCYAIKTTWTPEQVFNDLWKHLDDNDQLYVIALKKPWWGYGPRDVNKWLDDNLP